MSGYGYTVKMDEEIMIIFGGITIKNKTWTDNITSLDLYNNCEKIQDNMVTLPYDFMTCGEELLNDMWMYHVLS